jgi:hypothetical protein
MGIMRHELPKVAQKWMPRWAVGTKAIPALLPDWL